MNKKYAGINFRFFLTLLILCLVFFIRLTAQEVKNDYKIRTVVIDAGHGGKDPGSVGKQTSEKHVVLAISLKLGAYIEQKMPEIKVIYTRKTDELIPLYKRAEIANENDADLFISIHANGNDNTNAYGTETLLLGYHRANENFEVAKQENSVILLEDDYTTTYEGFDPNSPESYIMFALLQERYFERSVNFAALVQDQFRDRAKRKDRGVYRQGLLVLAKTAMPGVLVETGFVTNPEEEKFLMSDQGQDLIASAIFRAFRDYKNVVESKSVFATASKTVDLNFAQSSEKEVTGNSNGMGDNRTNEQTSGNLSAEEDGAADAVILDSAHNEKSGQAQSLETIEFKVQVTASSHSIPLDDSMFDGFEKVAEYQVNGLYKYAVGSSPTFEEIMTFSSKVRERFPDAFVIGVKNGGIIPLNQALSESRRNIHNN